MHGTHSARGPEALLSCRGFVNCWEGSGGGGGVLWSGSALSESTLRWWGSCVFGFAWGAGMDCLHSLALNQTVEGWRPQTCNRALPAQLGLAKAELLQFILSWLTLPCSQAA